MKNKSFLLIVIFTISVLRLAAQYPIAWNTTGIGGGGSLFSPSINPANNNEYYVACDMSELFHTTNFGTSYDIVDFRQLTASTNSVVRFTNNANIRYSINSNNNGILPVKSTDGGNTWTTLSGNPDASEETYGIWADYNNPNRVIISYYGYIYFSNNGGTSFTNIHTAVYNGSGVVVGGVFFDGANIYIGTNDGLLESTNNGVTFTKHATSGIPPLQKIFSFSAAKQNGATRFFCLTGDSTDIYVGLTGTDYSGFMKGVYTMDNNSGVWTSRMTGLSTSADYLMYVTMAENDTTTAYIGGSSSASVPNVVKTTNGGRNWTHVFNTTNNQNINTGWCGYNGDHGWGYPECLFGIAAAPNNKNIVLISDMGYITKTSDGGTSWQQAYLATADQNPMNANTPTKKYYHSVGMENTSSWFIHWSDANNVFTAFTDIFGIRSQDQGQSWAFDYTAPTTNTMYCIAKNNAGTALYAATSSIHDMYKSYRLQDASLDGGTGQIIFSTDKGATWTSLHNFGKPVYWLATDPNNSNRMYAAVINHKQGVGGIWVTNNLSSGASSTWTQLAQPARTQGHPATMTVLNNGKLLCSFSGRRNPAGAFTDSSGVFLYDPSGSGSWSDKSDVNQKYWCRDIIVDPNDATQNTWYCGVYSGWGGNGNGMGGLYKTTNAGTLWTKILDNVDVSSCTFNPNNPNEIFVTTQGYGLYYSNNVNNATPTFSPVANYYFSAPERVFFNPFDNTKIWITSFGHGMQWGDMTATSISETSINNSEISLFPNPANDKITVNTSKSIAKSDIHVFDLQGKEINGINIYPDATNFILDISKLAQGVYIIKINNDKVNLKSKFVKL